MREMKKKKRSTEAKEVSFLIGLVDRGGVLPHGAYVNEAFVIPLGKSNIAAKQFK